MKKDKISKIDDAISEAKRFIKTAENWKCRLSEERYHFSSTKEGGACKRASLDLTRVLTIMRRPV